MFKFQISICSPLSTCHIFQSTLQGKRLNTKKSHRSKQNKSQSLCFRLWINTFGFSTIHPKPVKTLTQFEILSHDYKSHVNYFMSFVFASAPKTGRGSRLDWKFHFHRSGHVNRTTKGLQRQRQRERQKRWDAEINLFSIAAGIFIHLPISEGGLPFEFQNVSLSESAFLPVFLEFYEVSSSIQILEL